MNDLELLSMITGGKSGFHELRWYHPDQGLQQHWVCVCDRARYASLVSFLGDTKSLHVEVSAVPRPQKGWGVAGPARCLWVVTSGRAQLVRLERFRPRPTLLLEEGDSTRRVALWAVNRALSWEWIVRANKRIAHALGAPKKHAEPEFVFVPPGVCVRDGRKRPVLVRVAERNDDGYYSARAVVGRLKDAPDPTAWMERAA